MQQQITSTVAQASVTGSRNAVALAALLRKHRHEVPDELIDTWASHLAQAGWRALDKIGVSTWASDNTAQITAGWYGDGLYIPYRDKQGELVTYGNGRASFSRVRLCPPDDDRKYLQPLQSGNHLYLPVTGERQNVFEMAQDKGFLFLTEGEIDAQWATFLGVPTIAVTGVDSWVNAKKEKAGTADGGSEWVKTGSNPIPELDSIPWRNFLIYVVHDSDTAQKRRVKAARSRLTKHIVSTYDAQVFTADIDARPGEKMGVGDWLLKIYREGGSSDDAIKKLRSRASAAKSTRLPGRRLGAQPSPLTLPGGDTIPDITQISDSELEKRITELESATIGDDSSIAPAIEALKSEQCARVTVARYSLDLRGKPYSLFDDGLKQSRGKGLESVTARPIWPSATGTDLATKQRMAQLKWLDDRMYEREQWVHLNSLTQSKNLLGDGATNLGLDALPVSEQNARAVAQWLTDSAGWLIDGKRDRELSSRTGWVETESGWRYVRPGGGDVYFTGKASPPTGSVDDWSRGIDILNGLQGEKRWQALALIGLCTAAPIVRFIGGGMQNPVIGVVSESSTGKTSLASFALSIYGKASEATYQAMLSTAKGLEAQALTVQDRVFCIDDAQTRDDIKVTENNVYFLANGQTRARSSRTGKLIGGEVWRGVGLYLAEYSLADKFAGGASLRTIELTVAPLENAPQSQWLKLIAEQNSGALSEKLYEAISDPAATGEQVNKLSTHLRERFGDSAKRDDLRVLALTQVGLELLQGITHRTVDIDAVIQWFAERISDSRKTTRNASTQAWEALQSFLEGAIWVSERWDARGHTVAWKSYGHIDINPSHPDVESLFKNHGGINAHLSAWAQLGLIAREGQHLKVSRRTGNGLKSRVLRIPQDTSSVTN